jgi:hypothetical protein
MASGHSYRACLGLLYLSVPYCRVYLTLGAILSVIFRILLRSTVLQQQYASVLYCALLYS